jgi:DNA (cytosine-5)-methyltransferase 1
MYVVFWKKGNKAPDLNRMQRPKAYCPTCDQVVDAMQAWKNPDKQHGRYRSQYVYRCPSITCRNQIVEPAWLPAAAAIDWGIAGKRIGDRTKPLAEKTMARIAAGIDRYWRQGSQPPFLTQFRERFRDLDPARYPLPTIVSDGANHGLVAARTLLVPVEGRDGKEARSAAEALRTQTTRNETGLTFAPFIAELRGGGSVARPTSHPMSTVTASGNHHGLVVPSGGTWNEDARSTDETLRTLVTRDSYAIVTRHNSSKGSGAEMSTPVYETLRTLTTMGHQSLATGATPNIEDCLFRMLEPHEVAAGMAFPADYIWEGNRRERVRLAGNAVTPPAARDLITAVAEALTGEAA